jgi:hypothetical protein
VGSVRTNSGTAERRRWLELHGRRHPAAIGTMGVMAPDSFSGLLACVAAFGRAIHESFDPARFLAEFSEQFPEGSTLAQELGHQRTATAPKLTVVRMLIVLVLVHQPLDAFVKRMMHPAQGMARKRPSAPGACAECQQEDANGQAQNSGTSEAGIGQSAASFHWRAQPAPLWQLPTAGAPYCEPFHPARICIRILP